MVAGYPNRTQSADSHGIYTYCLTKVPINLNSVLMGIDEVHEVYTLEHKGIFIIASDVSLLEFNEDSIQKNMTDIAWLTAKAKKHEEIVEFIMAYGSENENETFITHTKTEPGLDEKDTDMVRCHIPVIPLRFCTIYKNLQSLFAVISPHREKILYFLDYTSNMTEWSVKVFCDKTVFLNTRDVEDDKILAGQKSLLPGENYLQMKKMRKLKEDAFRNDLQNILHEICSSLSHHICDSRFLRCIDKHLHGRKQDMVMNVALLVEHQRFVSFRNMIDTLIRKYRDEGLTLELSGPWPLYNFCPDLV